MILTIDVNNVHSVSLAQIAEEGALFVIKKPYEWSSFQLVKKIRYLLRIDKVGHAGTLDPLADGLMLVAVGKKATKQIDHYIKQDKRYLAKLQLGEVTDSFDLETPPHIFGNYTLVSETQLDEVLASFVGEQSQLPPKFSAIKKDGKRMYELARKGIDVEISPRKIHIFGIEKKSHQDASVAIDVHCSSGTYIRSLANDIGERLGCGAYLSYLTRTHIGAFSLENATSWEDVQTYLSPRGKEKGSL